MLRLFEILRPGFPGFEAAWSIEFLERDGSYALDPRILPDLFGEMKVQAAACLVRSQ